MASRAAGTCRPQRRIAKQRGNFVHIQVKHVRVLGNVVARRRGDRERHRVQRVGPHPRVRIVRVVIQDAYATVPPRGPGPRCIYAAPRVAPRLREEVRFPEVTFSTIAPHQ